jgi:hypothetical protein
MLAVAQPLRGTGGGLAGIYDLKVSHGREAQLLLHDQTAIAANDPRSASLLGTGRGYEGQELIVMGGMGGGYGLLGTAEGAIPLHESHLGTGRRNGGTPLAEDMDTSRVLLGGRARLIAGREAQHESHKE